MATGKASDFKIYDEQYFGGMYESIAQNTQAFNAASLGCITLVGRDHKGDYSKQSFVKDIANLITRRDTTSVSAATDLAVTQGENVKVKINRKIGPVAQTLDAWRKISSDPREMSYLIGKMVGEKKIQDYLNTALVAARPALAAQASNYHNYIATGTITHQQMLVGLGKLGDQASRIKCFVMHSKPYFDLLAQAVTDKIVEVAGTVIYAGSVATFGRPVIVTDSAALVDTIPVPDSYWSLGLVDNAITVEESEAEEIQSQIVTGLENLVFRIQGEHAFTLGMKGLTWDVTNGGANPNDAAVGTATNWDKTASFDKDLLGIIIGHQ